MKKTYHGSCHCGAVRFEADIDLAETSRCNCSICRKGRYWKSIARAGELRLLAGEDMLTEYGFGRGMIKHLFCKRCGIKPFGRGHREALGGTFYGVNLACLDDATDLELAEADVIYQDGAHDDWGAAPAETRHL